LTIISTVHTKHGFVFLQRGENISQRTSRNSGHDRKSERRKIDFTRNNNCVFKKLNDGNTIYLPPKIKRFTLFFLAYYFYCEKKPFSPVTVGFVGCLITSAILPLLVFTKTVWVEPIPQQSTGRKFPGPC
jgi:hypothetical protein